VNKALQAKGIRVRQACKMIYGLQNTLQEMLGPYRNTGRIYGIQKAKM
jgi:hypothetical protein